MASEKLRAEFTRACEYLDDTGLVTRQIHSLSHLNDVLEKDDLMRRLIYRDIPMAIFFKVRSFGKALSPFVNVSIGSGCGAFERILFDESDNLICVDPDPRSYTALVGNDELFYKPDYSYVKDLIKSKPEVVGNNISWIIWPEPGCILCSTGSCNSDLHMNSYDLEAIQLLKPKIVNLLVCLNQSAGTIDLHKWLRTQKEYQEFYFCCSYGLSEQEMKFDFIVRPILICLIHKDIGIPPSILEHCFKNLPKEFYNEEDYLKVKKALPQDQPAKKLFDKFILDLAIEKVTKDRKAILEHQLSPTVITTSSSSNSQDKGFAFVFED